MDLQLRSGVARPLLTRQQGQRRGRCKLTPRAEGMVRVVAENHQNEFVAIKHMGKVSRGIDDADSDEVKD